MRQLLAYGADIEAQAYYDGILCSPLYLSVIHHHHETAELLLKQKATVKLAKSSMLHLAIKKDNGKMFELLLNYGADQEAINEYGQTPLYLAASLGKAYFIDKLIQSGANIERAAYGKFSRGPRPLHIAVYHRHLDAVALLVKAGASLIDDWNYDYNKYATATVLACEKGYAEIVELLIKHESQVKDIWLNKAIENIHPEIVQVLLSTGLANYLKTRTWERTTFLHVAVSVKRSYPQSESVIQIVKMLLDVGAHLESTDSEGNTALHLAAKSNNMAIVQLLIQKGAFTQALNRWGQTPLQAASTETGRMIKSLLDHIELENKMNNPKLIELEKIINQQKNEIELLKEEMNAIKQKLGMDKTSYESLKDNPPTTTLFFK